MRETYPYGGRPRVISAVNASVGCPIELTLRLRRHGHRSYCSDHRCCRRRPMSDASVGCPIELMLLLR